MTPEQVAKIKESWKGIRVYTPIDPVGVINLCNEIEKLQYAVKDLVLQFGYKSGGHVGTGGLSVLEDAFEILGWNDPHPLPKEMLCDEPGCGEASTCGWPVKDSNIYRRTCYTHSYLAETKAIP